MAILTTLTAWAVHDLREAQRIGPAQRNSPETRGGFTPRTVGQVVEERELLGDAPAMRHRALLDLAHWGRPRPDAPDLRGIAIVPTMRWLADQLRVSPRTIRRDLDRLETAGLVTWLAKPSRSRPGVLQCDRYPTRERTPAAAEARRRDTRPTPPPANRRSATVNIPKAYAEGGHPCPPSEPSPIMTARVRTQKKKLCEDHGATIANTKRVGSPPAFVGVSREELGNVEALKRRHAEAVAIGAVPAGERGLLKTISIAQHALRAGKNPPAMFASNLRAARDFASDADEDAARAMLREREAAEVRAALAGWAPPKPSEPESDDELEAGLRRARSADARHGGHHFERQYLGDHGIRVAL